MISIKNILREHEYSIFVSAKAFEKKVNQLDSLLNKRKDKVSKKISITRKKNQEGIKKTQMHQAQSKIMLENLLIELKDIKRQQKILKASKKKSSEYFKSIRKIMMK